MLNDMLERRWLTNQGPFVKELELRIAEYLGVRHCIAVANGTLGLELVYKALGFKGEVIMPAFTFIATPNAAAWLGIKPVFCDIDPQTHNIDPKKAAKLVTPETTGIVGVHVWGRPCFIVQLEELAADVGVPLVFDAAHAFGCSHEGKMIGGFGDAEVFSFHATKCFNTFEGGAVTTNYDVLAEKIRLMKNFGFSGYDETACLGINAKMSETSAAMGLAMLDILPKIIEANCRNYMAYCRGLVGLPGVHPVRFNPYEKYNYQYIIVEIDEAEAGVSRDRLVEILHEHDVLARRYFYPGCHRMEPYRSMNPGLRLPCTEALSERVIALPTGTAVSVKDVERVCAILRTAIGG